MSKLKICVGITGSIAAYRSPDFVKDLVARGHEVRAVLTSGGKEFVSARVLETFTGSPVLATSPFDSSHFGTDHIALARWADVFVIYGATADFMARYALGLADDFLNLQLIATRSPVVIAPAMNPAMWEHPSVQDNLKTLQRRGARFVGPIPGKVACGETGTGHIAEISEITSAVEEAAKSSSRGPLNGKTILISAGPMRSGLDPVRFIQNRSSGKMGLELARSAQKLGAYVKVLLGPVEPMMAELFDGFEVRRYEGPSEYDRELFEMLPTADAFLSAAAVLDFEAVPASSKIERAQLQGGELHVQYKPVPDFVARAAKERKPGQKIIAFAAETGTDSEILARAQGKMKKKGVDALIANPVRPGLGPEAEKNEIWILKPNAEPAHLGPVQKSELAEPILRAVLDT
ncbi:MAG: bifunctional phosphopantothenoylcysteine decarboxylase/phosphopantothenate--cysteine ligase CoaBC [Bdellovibrionia bacterium]